MKEKPRVLTLYAPSPGINLNAQMSMKIRVLPYTPQAHFLVETLSEYHQHWNDRWYNKNLQNRYSLCEKVKGKNPVAVLERDELATNLRYLEFVRMFFGFHPSREIVTKLKELAMDDERTEQLLGRLKDLDKQFLYGYIGQTTESKRLVLATKKEQRDLIDNHLPKVAFWKHGGYARPDCLWFPGFNSFTGSIKDGQLKAARPLRNSRRRSTLTIGQMIDPIQQVLLHTDNPFLIFYGNSFYDVPKNEQENLPPRNLDLIDCFPHKDAEWKEFLERKRECRFEKDCLVEALTPRNNRQS